MSVSVRLTIAGTAVPCDSFTIRVNNHGAVGGLSSTTAITKLQAAGIDLVALTADAPSSVEVGMFVAVDGPEVQIFGGEFLDTEWEYASDKVTLHARDWAGLLVDQKRVLVNLLGGTTGPLPPGEDASGGKGIPTQNQKLSQIITAIAQQFDLTPDIRLPAGQDPDIGTLFGNTNDTILTAGAQPLWNTLQRLARDTGNVCYCLPNKTLVFGRAGAGTAKLAFSWNVMASVAGTIPTMALKVNHNPRRNQSFQVQVISYDPSTSKTTKGLAYVTGKVSTGKRSSIEPGTWTGTNATMINRALGTRTRVPIYTFHVDGLTAAQAQTRAQAIAADIAKRRFVVQFETDLMPSAEPSQPATLQGDIEPEFQAGSYHVTAFSHMFAMGEGNSAKLATQFSLLNLPPDSDGSPVSE